MQVGPFSTLVWSFFLVTLVVLAFLAEVARRFLADEGSRGRASDSVLFSLTVMTAEKNSMEKLMPPSIFGKH